MSEGPKRRWFQFSLQRLFIIVTASAIASSMIPFAIAAYKEWQWSQVGGPGYIKPFAPIRCFIDDSKDAGDEPKSSP